MFLQGLEAGLFHSKRMAQYLAGSYGENDVFVISDVADSFPNMIAYTDGKLNFVYPDSEEEYTYYKRLGDTDAGREEAWI